MEGLSVSIGFPASRERDGGWATDPLDTPWPPGAFLSRERADNGGLLRRRLLTRDRVETTVCVPYAIRFRPLLEVQSSTTKSE